MVVPDLTAVLGVVLSTHGEQLNVDSKPTLAKPITGFLHLLLYGSFFSGCVCCKCQTHKKSSLTRGGSISVLPTLRNSTECTE